MSWLFYYVLLSNSLMVDFFFFSNVITAFGRGFLFLFYLAFFYGASGSNSKTLGICLEFQSAIWFKMCMWKIVQTNPFLIGRSKYFSSQQLPAWTRGRDYTRGARWGVWGDTITRLYAKPARKEITTTRQNTNASIIAAPRSSQTAKHWSNFRDHACEDEVIFQKNYILIWVWYPWLYWTYIFWHETI